MRPGGLVCLITSAWFLDQRDEPARAHAGSRADLVSAICLPQGAVKRLANTDVQFRPIDFSTRTEDQLLASL